MDLKSANAVATDVAAMVLDSLGATSSPSPAATGSGLPGNRLFFPPTPNAVFCPSDANRGDETVPCFKRQFLMTAADAAPVFPPSDQSVSPPVVGFGAVTVSSSTTTSAASAPATPTQAIQIKRFSSAIAAAGGGSNATTTTGTSEEDQDSLTLVLAPSSKNTSSGLKAQFRRQHSSNYGDDDEDEDVDNATAREQLVDFQMRFHSGASSSVDPRGSPAPVRGGSYTGVCPRDGCPPRMRLTFAQSLSAENKVATTMQRVMSEASFLSRNTAWHAQSSPQQSQPLRLLRKGSCLNLDKPEISAYMACGRKAWMRDGPPVEPSDGADKATSVAFSSSGSVVARSANSRTYHSGSCSAGHMANATYSGDQVVHAQAAAINGFEGISTKGESSSNLSDDHCHTGLLQAQAFSRAHDVPGALSPDAEKANDQYNFMASADPYVPVSIPSNGNHVCTSQGPVSEPTQTTDDSTVSVPVTARKSSPNLQLECFGHPSLIVTEVQTGLEPHVVAVRPASTENTFCDGPSFAEAVHHNTPDSSTGEPFSPGETDINNPPHTPANPSTTTCSRDSVADSAGTTPLSGIPSNASPPVFRRLSHNLMRSRQRCGSTVSSNGSCCRGRLREGLIEAQPPLRRAASALVLGPRAPPAMPILRPKMVHAAVEPSARQRRAAQVIQDLWEQRRRARQAQSTFTYAIAANSIVTAWKKVLTRRQSEFNQLVDSIREIRHLAAVTIQKYWRGYRTRYFVHQEVCCTKISYWDPELAKTTDLSGVEVQVVGGFTVPAWQVKIPMQYCTMRKMHVVNVNQIPKGVYGCKFIVNREFRTCATLYSSVLTPDGIENSAVPVVAHPRQDFWRRKLGNGYNRDSSTDYSTLAGVGMSPGSRLTSGASTASNSYHNVAVPQPHCATPPVSRSSSFSSAGPASPRHCHEECAHRVLAHSLSSAFTGYTARKDRQEASQRRNTDPDNQTANM